MRLSLPMYWFPSSLVVAKEYAIISEMRCPECGECLTKVQQVTMGPKKGWPYPISGDHVHCRCERCGHEVIVEFEFREPKEGDDLFEDFLQVYRFYKKEFSGNPQAFAGRMYLIVNDVLSHRPELAENVLGFLADEAIGLAYSKGSLAPIALLSLRLKEETFMKMVDFMPPGLAKLFISLRRRFYH